MCWGLTNTSFPSGDRLKKRLQGAVLFSEHLVSALRSVWLQTGAAAALRGLFAPPGFVRRLSLFLAAARSASGTALNEESALTLPAHCWDLGSCCRGSVLLAGAGQGPGRCSAGREGAGWQPRILGK